MNVLETRNLGKIYGSGPGAVAALQDVNISIEGSEFLSIVGPSGSGKSSLLHQLGGVDRPSEGQVLIEGEDMYSRNETRLAILRRRKIGFVFQFFHLMPVLTVEENIALPLLMDRRRPEADYLDRILKLLGLTDRRDHLPSQLSGGQQQRVSVGRALIGRPSVILADEPTGNLDRQNGRDVMDLLKGHCRSEGKTLVLVTHDHDLAGEADRTLMMEDGRVTADRRFR